jgi:hypothetical protein
VNVLNILFCGLVSHVEIEKTSLRRAVMPFAHNHYPYLIVPRSSLVGDPATVLAGFNVSTTYNEVWIDLSNLQIELLPRSKDAPILTAVSPYIAALKLLGKGKPLESKVTTASVTDAATPFGYVDYSGGELHPTTLHDFRVQFLDPDDETTVLDERCLTREVLYRREFDDNDLVMFVNARNASQRIVLRANARVQIQNLRIPKKQGRHFVHYAALLDGSNGKIATLKETETKCRAVLPQSTLDIECTNTQYP